MTETAARYHVGRNASCGDFLAHRVRLGTHGDAKSTEEPQKPLTLSELLEIQTPLASQEEQPLQVERSAGELKSRSTWCHAGYWGYLGR
ncbi:hypothetical protein MRX96_050774 [Rhipicephalus microplus]